jgi:hypothetical protein
MSPSPRTTAVCILLGAMAIGLTACNIVGPAYYFIHGPEKAKKVYALDKTRPTVVFIDDRLNRIPRRASRVAMGETVEKTLLKQKVVKDMISSQSAMQSVGKDREGSPVPITEVGKAVGADVVIYVVVDEFALSRDGQTFAPGASMRAKVIDVASGQRLWPENPAGHPLVVRIPIKQGTVPDTTAGRYTAEDDLARQCGQEIAWLFYDHEAPKGYKGPE